MTTSLSEWDEDDVPHCPIHVECEQPCRACAAPLSPAEGEE